MVLQEGSHSFTIKNDGATKRFLVESSTSEVNSTLLMSLDRDTANMGISGDFTVGGAATTGPLHATVMTTSGGASVEVHGGGNGDAKVAVTSEKESQVTLGVAGGSSFVIQNDGSKNELQVRHDGHNLMTIQPASSNGTAATTVRGDVTVGGVGSSGAKAATVRAMSGSAGLSVKADSGSALMALQASAALKTLSLKPLVCGL